MSTLWVIGDSTLSSFKDRYYYPRYGYGTMLDKYLNDNVRVVNIALSGRSSKSYTTEPQYKELLDGMKKGDFLPLFSVKSPNFNTSLATINSINSCL